MNMLPEEVQRKSGNEHLFYKVAKSQAYFEEKIRTSGGRTIGHGEFILDLDIIALQEAIYIPLSFASGKKATGFVYQIEGTVEGIISTAKISCRGEGITQVVLGTLLYVKIPTGKTASFHIIVDIKGGLGKEYKIVINRINYKLNPSEARYKKFDAAISTKTLQFR
ncbi:hypothetical protein H7X87_02515 [Acetobacteraceae bacterium]|nr:hypothetical protein [Candidatus Parcubacteria bacterium]